MSKYANNVINILDHKIMKLAQEKDEMNIVSSKKDFTRNRKLPFHELMKMIVFMSSKPIKEELFDYFDYDDNTVTSSGFVQARNKILPKAFEELFYEMNHAFSCEETFHGYRLVAVDGTDLNIPKDINDTETLHHSSSKCTPFNLFHINAAYDILNNRYIDMILHGSAIKSEQSAMCEMIDRYSDSKTIFMADRNYATWNVMEHIIHSNQYFLIRAKDIHGESSLLRKFNLPDDEFDRDVEVTLTNIQTKKIKENPSKYRFLSTTSTFDYIDSNNHFYDAKYRVVRFKINGVEEYESIITNLDRDKFSPTLIKKLYSMRWSIETSFRHYKYSTNLIAVHAKKRNSIIQEIWGRAILYNLSMLIINHISKNIKNENKRWIYKINITIALHIIRNVIKRKGGIPPNLEQIIIKELLPIRPDRSAKRDVRNRRSVYLNYNLC